MPISHPSFYATYLAKRIGPYSTLGLAEDTWALNEGSSTIDAFLTAGVRHRSRARRCSSPALDRLRRGSLVCVFDATDRIQHMFWRDIDPGHPAARAAAAPPRHAIRDLYEHNDAMLGRVMAKLRPDDVLMVISDHGFSSFRRGINLNSWLLQEGYLTLRKRGRQAAEWLRDVDWSATKAYCLGLTGMFLNVQRTRGARHRRARRRPRAQGGNHREAQRLRDPGQGRRGRPRGVRPREAVCRAHISRTRPTCSSATTRAIACRGTARRGVVAGTGLPGQRQGVERRSLHRPAARAGRVLLQPCTPRRKIRRSSTSRPPRCGCSGSSRQRIWTGGPTPAPSGGEGSRLRTREPGRLAEAPKARRRQASGGVKRPAARSSSSERSSP